MKKLMLLTAMLAMVLLAVSPAIAQISSESGQEEIESGDAEGAVGVSNKGDLVNQCAAILNAANTGNATSTAAVSQYQTGTDDIEIEGSSIEISPELAAECEQAIAVKGAEKKPEAKVEVKVPEVKVEAKAPKVEVKPGEAPKVEVKVEEKKKEEKKKEEKKKEEKKEEKKKEEKKMPVTGGVDLSLIGLMAGALLAAGGLLVRRIIR